jgi:hypothetical protein
MFINARLARMLLKALALHPQVVSWDLDDREFRTIRQATA